LAPAPLLPVVVALVVAVVVVGKKRITSGRSERIELTICDPRLARM
jgi:hypothetical protein